MRVGSESNRDAHRDIDFVLRVGEHVSGVQRIKRGTVRLITRCGIRKTSHKQRAEWKVIGQREDAGADADADRNWGTSDDRAAVIGGCAAMLRRIQHAGVHGIEVSEGELDGTPVPLRSHGTVMVGTP
jgi:hypothetical protein